MSGIGLEPTRVRISQHSEDWEAAYSQEHAVLREALGDLAIDIQHVGSTAVPGLAAKPIIDIAVAVATSESAVSASTKLLELGYLFAIDAGSQGGLIFYREREPPVRTHHVHLVRHDDPQWRNYLLFRDRLRSDPALRNAYAALKERLAREFANDREAYTASKSDFVSAALT